MLRKSLIGLFLVFFSFCVIAEQTLVPYVGLDIQQRNMNFKKNHGDNIFSRKSLQGNFYLGCRLNKYFGLEGGYQSSQNTSKKSMISKGEIVLGQVVDDPNLASNGFIVTETTIRTKGPHLNVIGFFPLEAGRTDFIASLGLTSLTIKAAYKQVADEFLGIYAAEDVSATNLNFSAAHLIPRCMLGVQRQFTESLGLRASLVYELTGRFKQMAPKNAINDPDDLLPGNKQLKVSLRNTITYGLGIFMTF
ncbi:MAG: hypothetical protein KA508_05415 [Gammaproteobacteria bacterium]|nr:hypothetical protein [Gammaproteobacteria bacterium]